MAYLMSRDNYLFSLHSLYIRLCWTPNRETVMGRTTPTFVDLLRQTQEYWAKFRRALRRDDRPHFDRLFHQVRYFTPSAMYQCHDNAMETILLTLHLAHERQIAAVEEKLRSEGRLPPEEGAPAEPIELPFAEG
jgi:hypothetical protein